MIQRPTGSPADQLRGRQRDRSRGGWGFSAEKIVTSADGVSTKSRVELAETEPAGTEASSDVADAAILDRVVETPVAKRSEEVTLGRLVGLGERGEALVDFSDNPARRPLEARSIVSVEAAHVGREVALLFEGGDVEKPVIMGFIRSSPSPAENYRKPVSAETALPVSTEVDGERIVFDANQEIVLRCGSASITLTRAGKILLRGKYVLSRSSGVNRIKGGSVQIN